MSPQPGLLTPPTSEQILAQVERLCNHDLLKGDKRPLLLRFLIKCKLEHRFTGPFNDATRLKPTGRRILFEFYVVRAKEEGQTPPKWGKEDVYDSGPGKKLISGLIAALRQYYSGHKSGQKNAPPPEEQVDIVIEIGGGKGNGYEPSITWRSSGNVQSDPRRGNSVTTIDAPAPPVPRPEAPEPPEPSETRSAARGSQSRTPDITGRWGYIVYSADAKPSHSGVCTISCDDGHYKIRGERLFRIARAGGRIAFPARSHWRTDWCQICSDGELRFVYYIDIEEAGKVSRNLKGYCVLGPNVRKMEGSYHLLPPFDADVANAKYGSVEFTRMEGDAEAGPPPGYKLGEES